MPSGKSVASHNFTIAKSKEFSGGKLRKIVTIVASVSSSTNQLLFHYTAGKISVTFMRNPY